MLDQNGDEALERSVDDPVKHDGTMLTVVLTDVSQIEAFGCVVVELNGSELPLTTDAVGDFEIDLVSVKRSVPWFHFIRQPERIECALQQRLRAIPQRVIANSLRRPGCKL